jgi:hypothetical protein
MNSSIGVLLVLRNALVEARNPVTVADEILLVLGERLAGRRVEPLHRRGVIGGDGRVCGSEARIGADHLFRDAFRLSAIERGFAGFGRLAQAGRQDEDQRRRDRAPY